MTHTIQSSVFTSGRLRNPHHYMGNLYSVVVNTEDGEQYDYEVEADNFTDASRQAEEMANSLMADITYIEIYAQEYL